MKLENQVVSLELSKELKANGYPQGGLWWWDYHWEEPTLDLDKPYYRLHTDNVAVAPTVAELGERLPRCYQTCHRLNGDWECYQTSIHTCEGDKGLEETYPQNSVSMFADTEANAKAKMWLYLKKEGLL